MRELRRAWPVVLALAVAAGCSGGQSVEGVDGVGVGGQSAVGGSAGTGGGTGGNATGGGLEDANAGGGAGAQLDGAGGAVAGGLPDGGGPADASMDDADGADASSDSDGAIEAGPDGSDTDASDASGGCPVATMPCYTGPPGTLGVGVCTLGVSTCAAGVVGPCVGEIVPSQETCNGLDDDCNGAVDEGDPGGGGLCSTGKLGVCAPGTMHCSGGALVCTQNQTPGPETCNGLDDDCDGAVDEGDPGGGGLCSTGKLGVCAPGTMHCSGGALVCTQNQTPGPETCNGLDDDCDGAVDEGDPGGGGLCSTGKLGVCAPGTMHCSGGALVCTQNQTPGPETCNGLDDDCDGAVDEGDPGGGGLCSTGKFGVCAPGTRHCSGGAIVCTQNQTAGPETCNGLDDDCDGAVDEGDPGGGGACSTGKPGVCAPGTLHCSGGALTCVPNVSGC